MKTKKARKLARKIRYDLEKASVKYGELYERNGDYQNVVDIEIIEVIIYRCLRDESKNNF